MRKVMNTIIVQREAHGEKDEKCNRMQNIPDEYVEKGEILQNMLRRRREPEKKQKEKEELPHAAADESYCHGVGFR